jgi:effector-binding domain-containing protein
MPCLRLAAFTITAALTCAHPLWAQTPAPPATAQSTPAEPAPSNDPFGEEVTLSAKTIIYLKGSGNWDSAFETLLEAFKLVHGFLDRQNIKPVGPAMTIYTATDDIGFQYQAAVPIAEPPKNPPRGDIALGQSPAGKALKFVHRGSYDAMDETYEKITNYLDDNKLEAKDMFIEEYQTDPLSTPEDKLVVYVFVPLK